MKSIKSLNECFIKCFANADTFKNAQKTSDIDADISDLINNKIPAVLSDYIKGNYIVCGSVGKGLATKTPWVAILDREITTSTREGVYVVFLFASDFKQVYLTLNQGTTVPGAFGPRLGKKEVSRKSQELRELLKIDNELLCMDGNANIADEKYRAGAIYYTLWDIHDEGKGRDLLTLYLNIYKQYKKLSQNSNVKTKSQIGFKMNDDIDVKYRSYVSAVKSKPFLLLAGISGTGKSRIVRELARAYWDEGSEEFKAQKPKNFEMVQVKPNWHDSSELIGYVSRVSGSPVFVAGDFLKFVAKAWENPEVPYFLCLDEMNLAPVEQYFAEYLSVVESRKADDNGVITTDPILKKSGEDWYRILISELTTDKNVRDQFFNDGIAIPQNLIVVGTVNMDETTFSFSRKVLDRAMTIEMNEVDLYGGLDDRHEKIGKLEAGNLVGTAVEGVDVYRENKEVCDTALKYLQAVNLDLDGTPFKVAYRTRNEFLLYVVNNLPYNKDKEGNEIPQQEVITRALDEITSMKILSRIEGDSDKIGNLLEELGKTVSEQLKDISGKEYSEKKNDGEKVYSVSLAKLKEMEGRLKSGYTSFWSYKTRMRMGKIEELYQEWQSLLPIKEEYLQRLNRKFMLEFNYNSNHIEGNTLTYGQTELLLMFGRVVGNAYMKDLEEMKAHNVCLRMMQEEAKNKEKPLTEFFIRSLHQTMLREDYTVYRQLPGGVNTSYVVHAGCYKTRPNSVITPSGERFEYASPEETPALIADLIAWYNDAEARKLMTPVELAALFHYRYIRIHPFEDGNGRIARLLMNYIFLKHDYPMIVIRSKDKKLYLDALGKADKKVGPIPSDGAQVNLEEARDFVAYISQQMEKTLQDNMILLNEKADSVWWHDGEMVTFKNETTINILKKMVENPKVTIVELAKQLGISENAIQKQLKSLQEKGYLQRNGKTRGGSWQVLLVSTT